MNGSFRLAPEGASNFAPKVDLIFYALLIFSLLLTLAIAGTILYFAIKYRRRAVGDVGAATGTHVGLEITWMAIPLVIALGIFFWGARVFVTMSDPPADALEVHVIGKQWMWKIEHPGGRKEINALHLPLGRPIKLVMTSQDVIHNFYVPAFRIKQDVLPGRYSTQWFVPTKLGEYHLFCSQYCGTSHANMVGRVVVVTQSEYDAWLSGVPQAETPVEAGRRLFVEYGCSGCHGEHAPSLAGLYQSRVKLSDGSEVTADENYLRESILNPRAKIVAGYGPAMPTFAGQLDDEQLFAFLAYIKSLKSDTPANPPQAQSRPSTGPAAPTTQNETSTSSPADLPPEGRP